jgi:hypothetical protein
MFDYNETTRFVSGFVNPATIDNLYLNDKVRIRFTGQDQLKLLLLIERDDLKYLKSHIFETEAKFLSADSDFIDIKLDKYPDSIKDINFDKNNLDIELKIGKDTRIVKKYFGKLNIEDFKEGDDLYIVGRASDDGSFEAITIKNNSVWK